MTRTRSFSCSASALASPPSSGERGRQQHGAAHHAESTSSRRVTITGGGFRPMRCMAPSSAEIEPWRASSVSRRCFSCASSSPSRDSIRLSWASLCCTSLAVSTSRALMRSRSAAILSRSACSSLERRSRRLQPAAVGLEPLAGLVRAEGRPAPRRAAERRRCTPPQCTRRSGSSACAPRPCPIRPRWMQAERSGPANCPPIETYAAIRYKRSRAIMAWMSWQALRLSRCCRKLASHASIACDPAAVHAKRANSDADAS